MVGSGQKGRKGKCIKIGPLDLWELEGDELYFVTTFGTDITYVGTILHVTSVNSGIVATVFSSCSSFSS